SRVLIRKEIPGPPQPTLYLVEDESDLPFRRYLAQTAQEISIDDAYAALSLDGFNDYRRYRFFVERRIQLIEIPLADRHCARQRTERCAIGWAIGRGERREEPAMEAAPQSNQLDFRVRADVASPAPCELERPFVCLRTGVTKENLGRKRPLYQLRRQMLACARAIQIRRVDQAGAQRFIDRRGHSGVTIAERVDGHTAGEVEIPLAVGIDQLDALPPHEFHRRAFVSG